MIRFRRHGALLAVFLAAVLWAAFAGGTAADQTSPNLAPLFERLKAADDADDARAVERLIWRIWTRLGVSEVDGAMALGIEAMNRGAYETSLQAFNRVVSLAPTYAEGWNKRATLYYLMDRYQDSIDDIARTLELEPRHFGALSGLGLIQDALGNEEEALEAWERALAIHPFMTGILPRVEELRRKLQGRAI